MINLKEKLQEKTIGSWLTIGDPIIAEIMSQHFEWLVIDMEHSAITLDKCQDLIRIIELNDCFPLVRVSSNDPILIKRVLDAGARGIIVPMVNSKEDAERAVSATYYPPMGTRGVGLARAQNYGERFDSYKWWLERGCVVIAQIEHIDGVRSLDKILQVNGIDGIIVGPYDLSASLGLPGNFGSNEYDRVLNVILDDAKKAKKPVGIHVIPPNREDLNKALKEYQFVAFSIDTLFLSRKINEEMSHVKETI